MSDDGKHITDPPEDAVFEANVAYRGRRLYSELYADIDAAKKACADEAEERGWRTGEWGGPVDRTDGSTYHSLTVADDHAEAEVKERTLHGDSNDE